VKEAKPIDYIRHILPLLVRNGVVHFLGFGNRLGFDPLPSNLQVIKLPLKIEYFAVYISAMKAKPAIFIS
jgi:hypothetical protein